MTGSVTFTPTEADYVAAVRANYLRRLGATRFWIRMAVIVSCVTLIVAGIIMIFDGDPFAALATGLGCAAGGAGGLLVCIGLTFLLLPRRTARLFRQQRTIHQRFEYSWSDEGLVYRSESADGRTPWKNFRGWRETGPAFLIYMNDTLFQFLPLHAFTPDAADDLRGTLERSGLPIY